MTVHERVRPSASPSHRRRRLALPILIGILASVIGAPTASAAEVTISNASFEWGISLEVGQSAPPFGGCNYLSAGQSDGTQGTYQTSAGNVRVLKNGIAPTWANKCDGAAQAQANQKVVWSGGTGTVDPVTGAASLAFQGNFSINFYGGLVPFTIVDPVVTVGANGDGQIVATLVGYQSSIDNPFEKTALPPVTGVVVADLSGVNAGATGFTVTPDYEGIEIEAAEGFAPQNRTTPGWGSWPAGFVGFHFATGLSSYWYSSGGAADSKKSPSPITFAYSEDGGPVDPGPQPEPGEGQQTISVTVPEVVAPGEFLWSIDGDQAVTLSEAANQGTYLQSTGSIDPILVTDTRAGGPEWSVSGQVSDFTGGLSGRYLGWNPEVLGDGAGAVAGSDVPSGITTGDGLTVPSILAAAPGGHAAGTAALGADLDLRLPVDTEPGTYSTVLTITALS